MGGDRFESWKEIAAYLDRGVRTVQRWEKLEGLPVKRHAHEKLGTVYAFQTEIDAWWESRREELTAPPRVAPAARGRRWVGGLVAAAIVVVAAGIVARSNRPAPPPAEPLAPSPVTTLPGSEYFPTFSPDGNQVAFTWISQERPLDIYAKAVDSEALPIAFHTCRRTDRKWRLSPRDTADATSLS